MACENDLDPEVRAMLQQMDENADDALSLELQQAIYLSTMMESSILREEKGFKELTQKSSTPSSDSSLRLKNTELTSSGHSHLNPVQQHHADDISPSSTQQNVDEDDDRGSINSSDQENDDNDRASVNSIENDRASLNCSDDDRASLKSNNDDRISLNSYDDDRSNDCNLQKEENVISPNSSSFDLGNVADGAAAAVASDDEDDDIFRDKMLVEEYFKNPSKLSPLDEDDSDFRTIQNDFKRSNLLIQKVYRVHNSNNREMFEQEAELMLKQRPELEGNLNTKLLYHGSTAEVKILCDEGLDGRLSRSGRFGRGIYFSDNPSKCVSYSANDNNSKKKILNYILFCRVILGDMKVYEPGEQNPKLKRGPIKSNNGGIIKYYDSVKGCPKDHMEYVVYDNRRALIEYIIFFYPKSGKKEVNLDEIEEASISDSWLKTADAINSKPSMRRQKNSFNNQSSTSQPDSISSQASVPDSSSKPSARRNKVGNSEISATENVASKSVASIKNDIAYMHVSKSDDRKRGVNSKTDKNFESNASKNISRSCGKSQNKKETKTASSKAISCLHADEENNIKTASTDPSNSQMSARIRNEKSPAQVQDLVAGAESLQFSATGNTPQILSASVVPINPIVNENPLASDISSCAMNKSNMENVSNKRAEVVEEEKMSLDEVLLDQGLTAILDEAIKEFCDLANISDTEFARDYLLRTRMDVGRAITIFYEENY